MNIGSLSKKTLCCSILAATIFSCTTKKSEEEKPKPPNIIYILADDLGYGDLSCYGQQKFQTPNIDKLAAEGKIFTQHYAGSTVCAPSRSALMTGLHTGRTPIRGNIGINEGQYPLPDSISTISVLLKKKGYVTGAFGKWGLGYPGSEGDPVNQGIDEFYGYNSQTFAHNYYPEELWNNKEKVYIPENKGVKKGIYAPLLIHEKTLEFIERYKDSTFFLYVPSVIPHAEMFATEEYMDKFTDKASMEGPFSKVSKFGPETPYEGVDDIDHPRFKKGGYGSQPYPRAAFAAMVTLLDNQVGEIVEKVKELELEENTIIIFTSDNGPHREGGADPDYFNSNGPFRGYKRDLYEGGIRVPMIAKWPGKIASGSQTAHISAAWDVLPTLCEVVGIDIPHPIDGVSFYPELTGKEGQQQHEFLYWEFYEQGKKQAIRHNQWKAVRTGLEENPEAPVELYDLSTDPGEENNLAAQYPEVAQKMLKYMESSHVEDPAWPFFARQE